MRKLFYAYNFVVQNALTISLVLSLSAVLSASYGLFDFALYPATKTEDTEGRETPDTAQAEELQIDAQANFANLRGEATMRTLSMLTGAAKPEPVTEFGISCQDWHGLLPGKGSQDSWTKAGQIQHITIHTAGVTSAATPQGVANWHVGGLGWEHIGYNYVITRDGQCHKTLPTGTMPYAQFRWNKNDVAIMLEGLDVFTQPQMATLNKLVTGLAKTYNVAPDNIKGHRDWSQIDQAAAARGEKIANINNHVDPCKSASPCEWDNTFFGLRKAVADQRNSTMPDPIAPGNGPGNHIEHAVATWYGPGTTSEGKTMQGNAMFCGGIFDRYNEHTTAAYYIPAQKSPAWACGTWLRVTDEKSGRHLDVKVTDTGSFPFLIPSGTLAGEHHYLDMAEGAFSRLSGTPIETLNKTLGGNMHITIDVLGKDSKECSFVPESGYQVCFAFRTAYMDKGEERYGIPISDQYIDKQGRTVQDFSKQVRMIYHASQKPNVSIEDIK
jgi:hypothetical protein